MQRQTDIPQARVDELRERFAEDLSDEDLRADPRDRPDRDVVAYYQTESGEWKFARLQRDDDVLVNQLKARVIGPAKGREFFLGYVQHEQFGEMIVPFAVRGVRDRAPFNANEEPMPVVPGQFETATADQLRAEIYKKIDAKTDTIIAQGFVYESIRFSLSLEAQTRYNAVFSAADDIQYPVQMNSANDEATLNLEDKDAVRAFCLTALATVKQAVDTGSVQKTRVRSMTSIEELEAYADPR